MEFTGSYNLAWWHSTSFWTVLVDAHTGTHVHKDGGWEAGEQGEFVYYKWLWLQASCLHVLLYETCHLYHPESIGPSPAQVLKFRDLDFPKIWGRLYLQ